MGDSAAAQSRLGPDEVSRTAAHFGPKLTFEKSFDDIHVHQYDCPPGSWWHDGLAYCRIAFQQAGSPRLERVIDSRCERQLRPAGSVSISPAHAFQRWTWDCRPRVTILF